MVLLVRDIDDLDTDRMMLVDQSVCYRRALETIAALAADSAQPLWPRLLLIRVEAEKALVVGDGILNRGVT